MTRYLTVAEAAERSGLAEKTVVRYITQSRIPVPDRIVGGSPRWKASTIRDWLRKRSPRPAPVAACGTPSGWRAGCDCPDCTQAHTDDTRIWRRDRARIPEEMREAILADIAAGGRITSVAAEYGLTQQALHGQGRVDEQWRDDLDEALRAGRDPGLIHGTAGAWRHGQCRCPDCREAQHGPRSS
ncbi:MULTISPECIES: AlpA family transcriptional regulator [unclassified Crossiella]|uniref:helix-turn-helix transcriptional regulator n=1 Tax=unclassified Crossiella TaxID=2620835 RepID=UPI001FFF0D70|nr:MULTISPECIES: helix-turn-helix domain-containing protein [unclassified Crossiella]MCK2240935.1 helix-turn-helix domain-containing protein [Crossiella sp. S99.2]MCK2253921.1 helix-turn-helix domain-containing protein [Crossiella sp. S99.1]